MPVGHAPAFCSCGNAAGVTCQLCKVGMCPDCDVLSKPFADLEAWPVRVAGFGYVNRVWDYRYQYLNLKHHDGGAYGPFLYLNELLASLASAHGLRHRNGAGPVRHLCWITEQLERLPVAPCRRAWAFAHGLGYAYYVLLDERSRITPAAVPAS
jgi:hypothetical protein